MQTTKTKAKARKKNHIDYISKKIEVAQCYIDTLNEQIKKGAQLHKSLKRDEVDMETLKEILSDIKKR